jgi:predicted GNAT family N-acyltransferase
MLRPHMNLEDCKYDGDLDADSVHIGAFDNDRLVSIGTFHRVSNPHIQRDSQYQLRAMATLDKYRGMGAGSSIIKYAEELFIQKGVECWWCNARLSAKDYYQKLGLLTKGDVFDIPGIGKHIIMFKLLENPDC